MIYLAMADACFIIEGKQFISLGDMDIRIDSIEWVRVSDEENENCIAEEQLGETE